MKEITFYNEPELKESLLKYTKEHQEIDAYRRGSWLKEEKASNGHFKGCFYGCMTQSEDNTLGKASKQYGLPLWYVHVTEKIYEGLPENEWLSFPYEAIEVLPVGIDMNVIRSLWNYNLLKDQLRFLQWNKQAKEAVNKCMDLYLVPFDKILESAARSAEFAAWSAAQSARSAEFAAWSAAQSAAQSAAWSAAWSAAQPAEFAAQSAQSARSARSAYYSFQKNLLFWCINEYINNNSIEELIQKEHNILV